MTSDDHVPEMLGKLGRCVFKIVSVHTYQGGAGRSDILEGTGGTEHGTFTAQLLLHGRACAHLKVCEL